MRTITAKTMVAIPVQLLSYFKRKKYGKPKLPFAVKSFRSFPPVSMSNFMKKIWVIGYRDSKICKTSGERKMTNAKVMGEIHHSSEHVDDLAQTMNEGDYDAIFFENRKSNLFDGETKPSYKYILFLFGYIEWFILNEFIYADKYPAIESASKNDVEVFTETDAPIPIVYKMGDNFKKNLLFYLLPIFISLFFFIPNFSSVKIGVVVLFSLIIYPFFYFVLVVHSANPREDYMSNFITDKTEKKSFNNILVSCGGKHVDSIASKLENNGINVEKAKRGWRSCIKSNLFLVGKVSLMILVMLVFLEFTKIFDPFIIPTIKGVIYSTIHFISKIHLSDLIFSRLIISIIFLVLAIYSIIQWSQFRNLENKLQSKTTIITSTGEVGFSDIDEILKKFTQGFRAMAIITSIGFIISIILSFLN